MNQTAKNTRRTVEPETLLREILACLLRMELYFTVFSRPGYGPESEEEGRALIEEHLRRHNALD